MKKVIKKNGKPGAKWREAYAKRDKRAMLQRLLEEYRNNPPILN